MSSLFNIIERVDVKFWRKKLTASVNRHKTPNDAKNGKVFFIGAGAGDVDLLTIKAVKVLQQADVVLVDWLVNPEIYQFIPKHTERIFVGKKCGHHSMKQHEINQLLLTKALHGNTVVRLKGGDPSIFARLAEETEVLTEQQIPFQIIPGITAASGCAAYTGIPLTHRDCAHSVKFVTAHLKHHDEYLHWQHLAKEEGTLVFYMGLNKIAQVADKLIEHGMSAKMPVAVVDQGTSEQQKLCTSKLSDIKRQPQLAEFKGPALIIVGEVVNKRVSVDSQLSQNSSVPNSKVR